MKTFKIQILRLNKIKIKISKIIKSNKMNLILKMGFNYKMKITKNNLI